MAGQLAGVETTSRRSRLLPIHTSTAGVLPHSPLIGPPPLQSGKTGPSLTPASALQLMKGKAGGNGNGNGNGNGKSESETQDLLLAMAPLVKRVAYEMRQHLPPHVEMDDLVGAGTLGLVDALRKFDPTRKVKLESYARHRIRGGILDALRTLDPASRDMRRRVRKVEKTYRELEARLGRPVRGEEVARALGVSLKVWHRWAQEVHALGFDGWQHSETAAVAAKLPVIEENQVAVRQVAEDPFDLCYRREQRDLVNRALERLPERERLIMTLYYQHDLTMKEIASRLAVDESRVSQLHSEALERLKARVQASLAAPRKVKVQMVGPVGMAS